MRVKQLKELLNLEEDEAEVRILLSNDLEAGVREIRLTDDMLGDPDSSEVLAGQAIREGHVVVLIAAGVARSKVSKRIKFELRGKILSSEERWNPNNYE